MRRLGLIVALGALLGTFAGVLTPSPALAGRGHKWEFVPASPPSTLPAAFCGSAGNLTSLSLRGHVLVDVCAALS